MNKAYMVPQDGAVHHYTDTNGLIGILRLKSLWATNIQFLNDSLEYQFGLEKIIDAFRESLDRIRNDKTGKIAISKGLEESVRLTIDILQGSNKETQDGQFVCCFSNFGDDLGQWRGYAQEGYCITFDKESLIASINDSQRDGSAVRSNNVSYGDGYGWGFTSYAGQLLERMDGILNSTDAELSKIKANDPLVEHLLDTKNRTAVCAMIGISGVHESIPFIKEEGFADEQEMRVCVSHPNSVKFRPSKIGPIPYTELKFDPSTIKAITVGPGLNIDLRQSTLEYLLAHEFGNDHEIVVKKTGLSFRG